MSPPTSAKHATTPSVPPEEVLNVNIGVLGHVDSGKTSLVKTMSTLLSTAALDKSKQSRERGMTLDLGFSCFFLDMPLHLQKAHPDKKQLQITLVDCPGHASLIKTIIGGAQIIDMVLLVVDAFKGWQAQTTECLVLAELTSPHLVVALNKIDLFPPNERGAKIQEARRAVQKRLAKTKFAQPPMIGVSACVGGERVAASTGEAAASLANQTENVDRLVELLRTELPPPRRDPSEKIFYFSVDHCFPIRGQGTVLTGTALSGSISTNSMLEFPTLGLQRKVKSMQMFRRKVPSISQGDRAGICVSNLDPKSLERGIAASPGAVQLLRGVIALVKKVPYFPGKLPCGTKFHISVGHTTVMATVTFWGGPELLAMKEELEDMAENAEADRKDSKLLEGHTALGGDAGMAGLPRLNVDFSQDFLQLDALSEDEPGMLHWAMLDFQTPVYCPLDSLIIGSRLDTDGSSSDSSCRLAFSGRLVAKVDPKKDMSRIRLYTPKERKGVISRLGDPFRRECDGKVVRYEVFGSDLFKAETNMKPFVGMKLLTETGGEIGEIKSSFGTSGKFRVYFPAGTEAKEGDSVILSFKRYANDATKSMHQDIVLPKELVGTRIESNKSKKQQSKKTGPVVKKGKVEKLKGDVLETNGKHTLAIVSGFFTPEINIRERVGTRVYIPSTKEEGKITGQFGKAGKCKVMFEEGVSAAVGAKAEMHMAPSSSS